jgi:hypothetical protein
MDLSCTLMGGNVACDCYVRSNSKIVRWTILVRRLIGYNHVVFVTTLKPLLFTNGLCTEWNTNSVYGICCLSKRKIVPVHALKAYEE